LVKGGIAETAPQYGKLKGMSDSGENVLDGILTEKAEFVDAFNQQFGNEPWAISVPLC
jgi:hypothetical protein